LGRCLGTQRPVRLLDSKAFMRIRRAGVD